MKRRTGAQRKNGVTEALADENSVELDDVAASVKQEIPRRARQAEDRRRRLFDAARKLVGEVGYTDTTIAKITKRANLAQGTFYNYFESRQDLFEKLLPALGDELQRYLDEVVRGSETLLEQEERCLRAFFDFSRQRPEFYRILTEAEVFVPKAHRRYVCQMVNWYLSAFGSEVGKGPLADYSLEEREVIAYVLVAAHHFLTLRYTHWIGHTGRISEWVIDAYMRFIRQGFGSQPEIAPTRASGRPAEAKSADADETLAALRFVPQLARPRPYLENAAFASQVNCRTRMLDDGRAVIELDLEPHILNSRGTASGGLMTSLAELAGATTVCFDREESLSVESIGISTNLIRSISEGTLVAAARRENAGRNIRFVTVQITRDTIDGELLANISATYRVLGD